MVLFLEKYVGSGPTRSAFLVDRRWSVFSKDRSVPDLPEMLGEGAISVRQQRPASVRIGFTRGRNMVLVVVRPHGGGSPGHRFASQGVC